jgi:hypothetical protein
VTGYCSDPDSRVPCRAGGEELPEQLPPWRKTPNVVDEAGTEDDQERWKHSEYQVKMSSDESGALQWKQEQDGKRAKIRKADGDSSDAWNGLLVKFPDPVRHIDNIESQKKVAADAG